MIVMKFGGSSLASPSSIKRAAAIVASQIHRAPVVVVSAFGDTTDHLLNILTYASRGNSYLGWKLQEELKMYHFCLAEDLVSAGEFESLDSFIRQIFRDLHVRMLEVCGGERLVNGELRDWVVSLGEQLSSRIVASAFSSHGIATLHMDARKLILTDDRFAMAEPRYWETYAKIRWAVPIAARDNVVVLGGFIGAAEDGRTTTLGRGGSDLTASLVGAAINAEEIQLWKDVDGLLTWDPRIKAGGYRVKYISYPEIAELARAGAAIIHPDSIAPAQRLRIPITIRNTFRPECEGTEIGIPRPGAAVKSIACKKDVALLELRSPTGESDVNRLSPELRQFCSKKEIAATLVGLSETAIYLALEGSTDAPEFGFALGACVEAHIRPRQAIISLVGDGITESSVLNKVHEVLAAVNAFVLPVSAGSCSIHIAVPAENLLFSLGALERAFFSNCDPRHFTSAELTRETGGQGSDSAVPSWSRPTLPFRGSKTNLALPPARA